MATCVVSLTHCNASTGAAIKTTTLTAYVGGTLTLSKYADSTLIANGYVYDHATNASGTTIETATITGAVTFYLYYTKSASQVTVSFVHRDSDTYTQLDTSSVTATTGGTLTLSKYSEDISGYSYSYATDSSGNVVTSATITAACTFYLYYAAEASGSVWINIGSSSSPDWRLAKPYIYNGSWHEATAYIYTSNGWKEGKG